MSSYSSRRSSSPFSGGGGYRRPSTPSSTSSSSSISGRLIPRSSSASYASSSSGFPRSLTPTRGRSASRGGPPAVCPVLSDELAMDVVPRSGAGESISVTVRFRPLNEREFQRGDEIAWFADGDKLVRSEYNPATGYAFDRVFGPATTSQPVYDVAARPVVKAAMEGINGTVFAYGVTSSGKTHTMHGDHNSPGIIPLAIKDVFSIIQDTPGREFLLRVSYLEIYNEVINDLLDPTGQNLRVREDIQGTYVAGIKEEVVLSPGHALSFIAAGEEHRHVGSNNFNLFSSRSHTIFTLMIESSARDDEFDGAMYSQLNLIDLAGSESSKAETTGLRRKEGSYINKSLLTLGTVIGKLSEGKATHVPYRDSKLTRLLQSSLSGHGHVSLICTITPASSNMEETHNTLKFASRAKRVEIYASQNRIIDEKSLIRKYQKEISSLKQELDQLRKGMTPGKNQDEFTILRQQLEEKMQSRLEEEEEAKAALMSRIQRLTKLILVSTKSTIPGCLTDLPIQQRRHSSGDDEKPDIRREGSPLLVENESTLRDSGSCALLDPLDSLYDVKHKRSLSMLNEDHSSVSSSVIESTQLTEHMGGATNGYRLPVAQFMTSDQMDLLAEQVKMLAGEIAFNTSTLKRLVEQTANGPDGSQIQVQKLENEINEKRKQMRTLEQKIIESNRASVPNASLVDMQQTVMRLMTQCNQKGFELEIKSADNRILQEQLQAKCSESKELQQKVIFLQQQLDCTKADNSSIPLQQNCSQEIVEFKRKLQLQDAENENLINERCKIIEDNQGLLSQNQKLADEASYAKELASAAAVELKNLAEEVTKLSLQNARQAQELSVAQDMAHSRANSGNIRKIGHESQKQGRRNRSVSRGGEIGGSMYDDVECWNLDLDNMKMELQARKQREAALEATLSEKELLAEEYKKKFDEAKNREIALENDLAGMWVLVAKLKKGASDMSEFNIDERFSNGTEPLSDQKENKIEHDDNFLKERQLLDRSMKPINDQLNRSSELEPLLVCLKVRIQEMKEKEVDSVSNGDANSHVCKVCFESASAAVLLPCRHFCLCKPCSLACLECPVCRTKIADRIITFTS